MEFSEVVRRRHMVREFTGEPVSPESLDRILEGSFYGELSGYGEVPGDHGAPDLPHSRYRPRLRRRMAGHAALWRTTTSVTGSEEAAGRSRLLSN